MLNTTGCYAAPLDDCDGGPTTGEHYISEALLKQFGRGFLIDGVTWTNEPRRVGPGSLTGHVLCRRHNEALSPLDETMASFHRALRAAQEGRMTEPERFDGELLERWAIKALLGSVATGTLYGANGRQSVVPEQWLRVLFGERPMPDGCGFYYVGDPIKGMDADLMSLSPAVFPEGDPDAGSVFGVTVQFSGFRYITTLSRNLAGTPRLTYRPNGFVFGEKQRQGPIYLRWGGEQKLEGGLLLSNLADYKEASKS